MPLQSTYPSREELYPLVRKKLREWYPENRGWKIMDRTESPGILPDFLIEKNSGGRIERSICCIETVAAITEDIVRRIEHYSLMLSGKDIAVLERILAVPTGTDTKLVPRGYSILHLPVPRPA